MLPRVCFGTIKLVTEELNIWKGLFLEIQP